MSISQKVLKRVQRSLPQLRLCKDMLVLKPTEHIVRGFLLERTPYKGTFYLWRLVTPLFRVTLDYSDRIPKGEWVKLSKEDADQSAELVANIISDDLQQLEKIQTPEDFLGHIRWMIGNDTPNFLFDLAVTYFLVGQHEQAVIALDEASVAAERSAFRFRLMVHPDSPVIPVMDRLRRRADCFAAATRSDPAVAARMVDDWERVNIAKHGLAEAMLTA